MKHLLLPALFCVPLIASAQSTTPATVLTDEQTANILKQLEQIEAVFTKSRSEVLSAALAKFRPAMASESAALALYLDCYKLEHYDKRNLKQSDFQDWKDRNEDRLKDEEFTKGLLLQLEHLVLSIQAQDVKDLKDMGPAVTALQAYIPKVIGAVQATVKLSASGAIEDRSPRNNGARSGGGRPQGGGQLSGVLRQPVLGTEFSRAFKLDDYLRREEWEYAPLNIAGHYSKIILPYYLSEKPAELPAQWDKRINAELALRQASMSEAEFAEYLKENQPQLQWQKASYLLENKVNPILALADMLKIVRDNPTHANAQNWIKELRQAVTLTQPELTDSPGLQPGQTQPPPAPPSAN